MTKPLCILVYECKLGIAIKTKHAQNVRVTISAHAENCRRSDSIKF